VTTDSTLHVYNDVTQGSEEWLELRRGIVTASVVGLLVTPTLKVANNDTSRGLTAMLVAERITGWIEEGYVSQEMWRGKMDEPLARDLYSNTWAPVTETGFMVRDFGTYKIGCSPDGLVGDFGGIEVKSRAPKKHLATILAGVVPGENMAQVQTCLLVSGRDWWDYVSYCGGMPMWRVRIEPDPAWFAAIKEAAANFEELAGNSLADYTDAIVGLPTTERIEYFPEPK
jgi:YqaJ-like viral recombinase domain